MSQGWDLSADAWIRHIGPDGDYGRRHVLDAPMLALVRAGRGLVLTHFDEPEPVGGPPEKDARYRRAPYFHVMAWQKPV